MKKKGQIYIIAAIILAVLIFAIVSIRNVSKQEKFRGDFEKLSQNYEVEGSKMINTLVSTGADVGGKFGNFTYAFTAYSKTQNPKFGMIYVLDYKGKVNIGNYLDEEIYIDDGRVQDGQPPIELKGCFDKVSATVSFGILSKDFIVHGNLGECMTIIPEPRDHIVYIGINDSWYPFEVQPEKPQLMVVSRMEQAEQRKVFVGGQGFLKKKEQRCKDMVTKEMCESLEICKWDDETGKCEKVS